MMNEKKKDKSQVQVTLQRIRAFSMDLHKNCAHDHKPCEIEVVRMIDEQPRKRTA